MAHKTKRRKWIELAAIGSALFFVAVVFAASAFFNALIGEDLILYLTPTDASFYAQYGNITPVQFTLSTNYRLLCTASCQYSFKDHSKGADVDNGSFTMNAGELFQKNYLLELTHRGTGQFLYTFQASCRNVDTFLCVTTGDEHVATSLVTLNYNYTEAELELKNTLNTSLSEYFREINELYAASQLLEYQISVLEAQTRLDALLPLRAELNDQIQRMVIDAETFRTLWNKQDYALLSKKYEMRTPSYHGFAEKLEQALNEQIAEHNRLAGRLNGMSVPTELLLWLNGTEFRESPLLIASELNQTAERFLALNYTGYAEIEARVDALSESLRVAEENASAYAELALQESHALLKEEREHECRAKGYCLSTGNRSISQDMRRWQGEVCSPLLSLENEFADATYSYAEQQARLLNLSLNGSEAYGYLAALWNVSELLRNSSFQEQLSQLALNLSLNATLSENTLLRFALNLSRNRGIEVFLSQYCAPALNGTLAQPSLPLLAAPPRSPTIAEVNETLGESAPQCCVFGACRPCCTEPRCRDDPYTYPVVFVHGHSFNSRNAPELAADSFGSIQKELQEEGYLNAGILYSYSAGDAKPGEWGLSGKPVSVSLSYYYDTIRDKEGYKLVPRKSQEIPSYALRLRELVDVVKQRTGRDKVILVAHSMGGLVARSYLQIFGDESVEKLVMVGTPNHGVNRTASVICGYFGEEKECEDMTAGSLFLSKLNDPQARQPAIPLYNIIGTGCPTSGGEGDGAVTAQSAYLENAKNYYIKGNCSTFPPVLLHTEMLQPDTYPEAVSMLKQILRGNESGDESVSASG